MHILIVEDEQAIAENIFDFLEAHGHRCDYAANLAEARRRLAAAEFDGLVLDRGLPDGDGLALAQELRTGGNSIPILVLTARDTLDDKLAGFGAGSDDYLVKPFSLRELEARLLALGRRPARRSDAGIVRAGKLAYDNAARQLLLDDQPVTLPPKVLSLAALLVGDPGRVFLRRELEVAIWGEEQESGENLRNLIYALRKGLGSSAAGRIVTVHGLGVKLDAD
jgi:DNA-binding response OmpR family regulator